jgi:hypothetical protein
VDTTSRGAIDAVDITFPGLAAFDTLTSSFSDPLFGWSINATNGDSYNLLLAFDTTPPGSLVGFDGGAIDGDTVSAPNNSSAYSNLSGKITPAPASVPEPSFLVPLTGGLGCLVFVLARRFGKESAIH